MEEYNPLDSYTLDEQKRLNKCYELYKKLLDVIEEEKFKAIECLENKNCSKDKKKYVLTSYFSFRLDYSKKIIPYENSMFSIDEMIEIVKSIPENLDLDEMLNNIIYFFEESITLTDEILAFHNYRLDRSDYNLSIAVYLINTFISCNFGNNLKEFSFPSYEVGSTYEESVDALKIMIRELYDFCNKHANYIDEYDGVLIDDRSRSFSSRIDYDAGEQFALYDYKYGYKDPFFDKYDWEEGTVDDSTAPLSEAEFTKEEANLAGRRISFCIKSIFMLLSLSKEISELQTYNTLKELKVLYEKIFGKLFCSTSINDLFSDKRLTNNESYQLDETELEYGKLQNYLNRFSNEFNGFDSLKILRRRNDTIEFAKLLGERLDSDAVNNIIDAWSDEVCNIIVSKQDSTSLDMYIDKLSSELGEKISLLNETSLKALATAELLYDEYVLTNKLDGFDYSGIATLYFQAFESAYDALIIGPYAKYLSDIGLENVFLKYIPKLYKYKTPEEKKNHEEVQQYYDTDNVKNIFDAKSRSFKSTLTYGEFFYLWNWLYDCLYNPKYKVHGKECKEFIAFLQGENCFNCIITKKDFMRFYNDLKHSKKPRNDASHGARKISIEEVQDDKMMIYDSNDLKNVQDFKNLLYQLLAFFSR